MNYQLFALSYLWPAVMAAAVTAIVYLMLSTGRPVQRLLVSLHGGLLVLAAGYALVVSPWSEGHGTFYIVPFWILLALCLISVIFSFFHYRGGRVLVHGLQLVVLPSAVWIWFIGTMTITHDWL